MKISPSSPAVARPAPKEWTVLYAMNGNNDLEPWILQNVLDIEKVGSSDDVNIVAQLSRAPRSAIFPKHSKKKTGIDGDWIGCRRYRLEKCSQGDKTIHSPVLLDSPAVPNQGDARTLADFVAWGMENFPARHYMVVIGDHGEGFRGTGIDKFYHDRLELPELRQALELAHQRTGIKPDILTFDSCLMSHAETAFQLKDRARFLVASEELVGAEGLPNAELISYLKDHPSSDPRSFAKKLVELSRQDAEKRAEEGREEAAPQMSAIDLARMGEVGEKFAALAEVLAHSGLRKQTLREIIRSSKHFDQREKPLSDYRDVSHFCQNLAEHRRSTPEIRKAAQALEKSIDEACIARHNVGLNMEDAQGMSVYLPAYCKTERYNYASSDFAQATGWAHWLEAKLSDR